MPIYEYVCEKCSLRFEKLKSKMTTNSREDCPECDGVGTQQLSAFGVGSSGSDNHACAAESVCPGASSGGCASGGCPFSQG